MHDYHFRGVAGGGVRKSIKTKGEFCEEARIAVRNRLKTKGGVFGCARVRRGGGVCRDEGGGTADAHLCARHVGANWVIGPHTACYHGQVAKARYIYCMGIRMRGVRMRFIRKAGI